MVSLSCFVPLIAGNIVRAWGSDVYRPTLPSIHPIWKLYKIGNANCNESICDMVVWYLAYGNSDTAIPCDLERDVNSSL
ncbi:hypothetical protein RSAG8_11216, partial [Rhizoctonia solani AG-8 WAC10335]